MPIFTSIISLLPAFALVFYIYKKDSVEKEPFSLLSTLFVAGSLVYVLSYLLEKLVIHLIDLSFVDKMHHSVFGEIIYNNDSDKFLHLFGCALAIAITEELLKWVTLLFITKDNKNFDCLFDGIVYSVYLSFGFATIDCLRYAFTNGIDTLIYRMIVSVPIQLLFGIVSGLLYTLWHTYRAAHLGERRLYILKEINSTEIKYPIILLILSLIMPIFCHFIYACEELSNTILAKRLLYILVIMLYIIGFYTVQKISKRDDKNEKIADTIIKRKHPDLYNHN